MRVYFARFMETLSAPCFIERSKDLDFTGYFRKRRCLRECQKLWGYSHEQHLRTELQTSYQLLSEAVQDGDEAEIIRYLSIDEYQRYKINPQAHKFAPLDSMRILEIGKVGRDDQFWMQCIVAADHPDCEKYHLFERKIFKKQFNAEFPDIRKWYIARFQI